MGGVYLDFFFGGLDYWWWCLMAAIEKDHRGEHNSDQIENRKHAVRSRQGGSSCFVLTWWCSWFTPGSAQGVKPGWVWKNIPGARKQQTQVSPSKMNLTCCTVSPAWKGFVRHRWVPKNHRDEDKASPCLAPQCSGWKREGIHIIRRSTAN